jgi:hypothetical protein
LESSEVVDRPDNAIVDGNAKFIACKAFAGAASSNRFASVSCNAGSDWHDGLEVLRGIAAVSVMLFHCIGLLPCDASGTPLAVLGAGWIGVDLFFVISD